MVKRRSKKQIGDHMAQGIQVPIKTKNGRIMLLSSDDYIDQLVRIALGDSQSSNPFQDIGLGDFMIFAIDDAMTEGEIRRRVIAVFDSLERDQLAKINQNDIIFEKPIVAGEKRMSITYTNLETQERQEIEVPIPPVGE